VEGGGAGDSPDLLLRFESYSFHRVPGSYNHDSHSVGIHVKS
jgi:hypothetical protein